MKKGGGSESTIIIGPSKSVLVYALHNLEYVLGLARFRVFMPNLNLIICRDYCLPMRSVANLQGAIIELKIETIDYNFFCTPIFGAFKTSIYFFRKCLNAQMLSYIQRFNVQNNAF